MSVLEQLANRSPARDEKAYYFDCEHFTKIFPELYMFLAAPEAFGKPRESGSIKIFCNDGKLKALLVDPSSNSVGWTTLDPNQQLWTQLEASLSKGTIDWREGRGYSKNGKAK